MPSVLPLVSLTPPQDGRSSGAIAEAQKFSSLLREAKLQSVVLSWDDAGSFVFTEDATDAQKASAAILWLRKDDPSYPMSARKMAIDQINALEAATPVTERAQREFMLAVATMLQVPLDSTDGLRKAKALNDQIAAIRANMPGVP